MENVIQLNTWTEETLHSLSVMYIQHTCISAPTPLCCIYLIASCLKILLEKKIRQRGKYFIHISPISYYKTSLTC